VSRFRLAPLAAALAFAEAGVPGWLNREADVNRV